MAVFSSTQNTAAWAGGFRYRPMTSAALDSKSGSLETMCRSRRWGCRSWRRQMRCTSINETPSSAASLRLLQCVEPSRGRRLSVYSSTRASSRGRLRRGARPGWRPYRPASRSSVKRAFHVAMKRESQLSPSMIASRDAPSSSSRISFARRTCATAAVRLRCKLSNSCCSDLLRFILPMDPIWGAFSLFQWTSAIAKRPWASTKMLSGLRLSVERSLKQRKTRFVIIDEAIHILRQASERELPVYMDTLKSLANTCGVTFVLVGSYDLYGILSLSGQFARRTHLVHFTRYRKDVLSDHEAFKKTALTLAKHMPVEGDVDLLPWIDSLMENTVGCVGILKDVLQRASTLALMNNGTWKDSFLERSFLTRNQTRVILQETLEGEALVEGSTSWRTNGRLAA